MCAREEVAEALEEWGPYRGYGRQGIWHEKHYGETGWKEVECGRWTETARRNMP
jgi:hypothetical protein